MNFSFFILESLRKNGVISVSDFGTFYLKNANATVDHDSKNILPPGNEIAFKKKISGSSEDLARFICKEKNIPSIDAEIEVLKLVNSWKRTLESEKKLSIENIGNFSLNGNDLQFLGFRTESLSPDFYGLEQINISEIKTAKINPKKNTSEDTYKLSHSFWWVLLLLVGIAAITFLGITQPESIFGKKSFGKLLDKKPIQKIKTPIKIDSTSSKIDSLKKTDSIKTVVKPTKNNF